ncbi:2'-5' RNA ligase family protein [Bacillus sp. B-jedd]|uniref:2'-5' RNA ligase family protein n=1 Tax=Bacillus sp. B-jedd TaxID=1476857 RepID=UPI00051561E2|nr:2'-5' RNA ligase family protein [Bacillus sp. B-jedd]CEG26141.1 RNA ligase or phosphoesterase [Bacillus sp. B-jedd]
MRFGVVLFPSKQLQDWVNSYRKRYDPHYSLIAPHLTVVNAFEATEEEAESIAGQLREAVKKHDPFTLKTSKISSFHPVNNVIYLKVDPSDEIIALHKDLNDLLESPGMQYKFVPHVTVGQKLSDDEHFDVYGTLKMQGIDHEEEIDRVHLLYQLENGQWTVYETFRLGKDAD